MNLEIWDDGTRKLVFMLCLPLMDGVFATLLVTGAIQTFSDVVAVALTVFAGAGAFAVLYSHSGSATEARKMVLRAAPVMVLGAGIVALVAPVFEQLFFIERLRYAAGLVLLLIAGQLAGFSRLEEIPESAVLLAGMAVSARNVGALALSLEYVVPAVSTALLASFALYTASFLRKARFTMGHIRTGGAAMLSVLALSLFGLGIPTELGLVFFAGSFLASLT